MHETLAQESTPARAAGPAWSRRWEWLIVALIALVAIAIRAWTLRGGLPYVDHPDEPNPINYVVEMLRSGDPNPHAFQKPSLYVYLLLAVLTVHYRLGLASGLYTSLDQMTLTTHLYTTIPGFFLWGRALTTTIAALTVVFAYLIGRRVWGREAGLIAALFLALSPFHMRHSQYVTTDVASGWLVLLTFGAAVAVAQRGRWRDYLAAGAFAGLAAATKYNAGVAALMVVAAHVAYWAWPRIEDRGWRIEDSKAPSSILHPLSSIITPLVRLPRLIGAGVAALLGFVAGTPYAVLSWDEFRRGVLGQVEDYGGITHGDFTDPWNWRGYLGFFLGEGLGWVACVALLLGMALLLWRRRAVALIWLSFVLPYVVLHLAQASHFNRNMLPVVVLGALPIGVAFGKRQETRDRRQETGDRRQETRDKRQETGEQESRNTKQHRPFYLLPFTFYLNTQQHRPFNLLPFAFYLAVIALLLPSALGTLRYSARIGQGDTRVRALEWVEANVAPGVRVAAELRPLPGPLESRWAEAPGLLRHDLAWYRRQGYAYLIASSDAWEQWAIPEEYRRFAEQPPLAEFGGASPRDMLGPHLAIYATGLAESDAPDRPDGVVQIGGARLAGLAIGRPDPKAPQLGLDTANEFKPGETLGLRTFWSVEQPFEQDFFIFVHVLDAAGATVTQRDTPPWQGRFPTSSWQASTLVVDVNDLALPAGLPPGEYTIAIGMFDPASGTQPPMSYEGQMLGRVPVAKIRVVL